MDTVRCGCAAETWSGYRLPLAQVRCSWLHAAALDPAARGVGTTCIAKLGFLWTLSTVRKRCTGCAPYAERIGYLCQPACCMVAAHLCDTRLIVWHLPAVAALCRGCWAGAWAHAIANVPSCIARPRSSARRLHLLVVIRTTNASAVQGVLEVPAMHTMLAMVCTKASDTCARVGRVAPC